MIELDTGETTPEPAVDHAVVVPAGPGKVSALRAALAIPVRSFLATSLARQSTGRDVVTMRSFSCLHRLSLHAVCVADGPAPEQVVHVEIRWECCIVGAGVHVRDAACAAY
jgi:hypothetical protein